MELNYINEFITLVETGNYMEAADELFLSQSTLSRHIQSIENDLGVQLFNRTTRKVELNEFGKTFLPFARQIQELKTDYTKALADQLKHVSTTISIGAIPTMIQYHITDILARFQETNPDFSIHITEADSSELEKMLLDGRCEFAFIRTGTNEKNEFEMLPYFTDHMVAVFPQNHPLANAESVSLGQLKQESFLFLPKGSMMYSVAMDGCKAAGFSPRIAFTGHRAENIVDLVSRGVGIGLLTRQPLSFIDTQKVSVVDVVPQFNTTISLAYKSDQGLNASARQFLNYYKSLGIR
jgi:DNA-binding transcriptional LysR family regulator